MSDKRMLILPEETVKRIDDNRGDMAQSDFLDFLLDIHLKQNSKKRSQEGKEEFVTRDELKEFESTIKGLLRNFIEFFTSYAIELGIQPTSKDGLGIAFKETEGTFTIRKPD